MPEQDEESVTPPLDEEKDGGLERVWREYIAKQRELAKARLPEGRRRSF